MKAGDRNTCLCKLHENMRFKVEQLHQLKLIETKNFFCAINPTVNCNLISRFSYLMCCQWDLFRFASTAISVTRHVFNIRHQFNSLKSLKDTIDETEAVLHVDSSENYNCKLAEETQAMHFGGSRSQASLHTAEAHHL
jgi:phage gp29-like protein